MLISFGSRGATISTGHGGGLDFLLVQGEIQLTDAVAFARKVQAHTPALVAFDSPGGNLVAGLSMGRLIHLAGIETMVADRSLCASACALAWLGGVRRLLQPKAKIGFHAAYVIEGGVAKEAGAGNALIGAYFNELGLSTDAIVLLTSAPPSQLYWLNPRRAEALGIAVSLLPSVQSARKQTDSGSEPNALEDIASAFPDAYFAHWSESNDAALAYYRAAYSDPVDYRGTPIPRARILQEKGRYLERWPVRVYVVSPGSVKTNCDHAAKRCEVTGDMKWNCQSDARNAETTGSAHFAFELVVNDQGKPTISGEWGEVIARNTGSLPNRPTGRPD